MRDDQLISVNPATNRIMQEFLDTFVKDPVRRMAVEQLFQYEAQINPFISPKVLQELAGMTVIFNDPKSDSSMRSALQFAANVGILAYLEAYANKNLGKV